LGNRAIAMGRLKRLHQIVGGDKINRIALLDCFQSKRNGQMSFTNTGWAQEDEVFLMLDKTQSRQITDTSFIDGRLEREIKFI